MKTTSSSWMLVANCLDIPFITVCPGFKLDKSILVDSPESSYYQQLRAVLNGGDQTETQEDIWIRHTFDLNEGDIFTGHMAQWKC
jgi:hypothetical protein